VIRYSTENQRSSQTGVPYQLMLIFVLVLAAYYPIAFGDFARIDDQTIYDTVNSAGSWNLRAIFIPHVKHGAYYRPVLFVSFFIDKYLFNLDPGFMHVHNIILHAVNSLLIYWLVRQLTLANKQGRNMMPFVSALVFGLHPITTESVCWIAGRTDVLAGAFILLSANFILCYKKTASYRYVALSAILMALAFLTKEVAIAFLPGAFLLMMSPLYTESESVPASGISSQGFLQRHRDKVFLLSVLGSILLFFLLRHVAFESNSGRITATIRYIQSDPLRNGLIVLQALGFYVKKIYFPLPLNFAITDLDPLYELLGMPIVVLGFLLLSKKKSKLSALFMTGIFMIMPAFLIATGQIAWTSFAERYMYLPTAFIMVASVLFIDGFMEKITAFTIKKEALVTLLLAVMAIATFHRSLVWKDSLSFLQDAVEKNPDFYFVRGQYAEELSIRGQLTDARKQFTIANEYNRTKKRLTSAGDFYQLQYWDMPDLGLADLLVKENKIPEAIAAYEKILHDSKGESVQALNNVMILYDGLLSEENGLSASDLIKRKMVFYGDKFYEKSDNPDSLFWFGRTFLARGDKRLALAYFKKAESNFSAENRLKPISRKFIDRLENE